MKKYILYILVISQVFMFNACSYLDNEPDDLLTLDGVFSDAKNTENWLAYVYSGISDPLWDYLSRSYGYSHMTDEVHMASSLGQFGWSKLMGVQQGNWNQTSLTPDYNLWNESYKRIRQAYIFLENVKEIKEQRLTKEIVERYKNEAKFTIAFYYARMLEVYGPVPLITEQLSPSLSVESLSIPRTPYDEIVNYLDKELLELSKVLPSNYDENDLGRATKGICLAVRARMLMFAASPLFNGNPDYADVKNPDGTPLFNSVYDSNKWKRAADAAKMVIDLPEYELYKEYNEDGSIDAIMSCMNVHLKRVDINKEIIFPYMKRTSTLYEYHLLPRASGFAGCIGLTQNVVDWFYMKNGLPISDPNSGYVEEGYSTEDTYYNTAYKYADVNKTPGKVTRKGTYNMYVNREPRFYVNVRFHTQYCPFDKTGRDHDFLKGGRDGKPSHDSPISGYQINKAIDPATQSGGYPYHPGSIIRLAEMYLDYAEALNEVEPSNPDILKYVNLIRERAGIPNLKSGMSQDEMREAIHNERRNEFALEGGMRYMDLRRWKTMEDVLKIPITGMNVDATTNDEFFKRTEIQTRVFNKKMYLWPIYQNYIDNNKNLVQNKYWDNN